MIRPVLPADHELIDALTLAAFSGSGLSDGTSEVDIIRKARAEGSVAWEAVAEVDGRVVGHALFTRMTTDRPVRAVALGPVAVDPGVQTKGHGAALIRAGLDALRAAGVDVAVVLGHPAYYPRFGYSAEAAKAIRSPYSGSRSFMAMALTPGALDQPLTADYPPAFD